MTRTRRPGGGEFTVGGRRAVLEAIRSGRARSVLVAEGSSPTQGLREAILEAELAGVEVRRLPRRSIEEIGVRDHQGVVAVMATPHEMDERALAMFEFGPSAVAVVLDGITDPANLGSCARASEAAGAAMLVARRRRAAPVSSAAVRASAGSLLHLPLARVPNLPRAIDRLKARGFFVLGLDQRASVTIYEAPAPPRPVAVVVGSEGQGISRLVREACDLLVAIPMAGRTASLNAASALAVGLFGYVLCPPA